MFRLVLAYGPESDAAGRVYLLDKLPFRLGRARDLRSEGGLTLIDSRASRHHACIEATTNGIRVRDLGSSNGTYVNGRVEQVVDLNDGDVLRVGSHLFVVQDLDEQACRSMLAGRRRSYPGLIGHSHRLLGVLADIERFGPTDFPVLVLGETGVGKEVVARAIHTNSGRRGPFIPVNCGSLPSSLIESELFGHEAGAFTGAQAERPGLFEEAEGGTILLDEIGDMPRALQVSLLRVLASGEIRRVGGRRPRRVNARVIAATHVDLAASVEKGGLRGDLYARLRGAVIEVPPLRERREDILELAKSFLARAGTNAGLSPDVAEVLLTYDWPFNVRELEQVMATSALGGRQDVCLDVTQLPAFLRSEVRPAIEADDEVDVPATETPSEAMDILRVAYTRKPSADDLRRVLRYYKGNVAQVAAYFRKDRRQIYRWCRQLNIDPRALRTEARCDHDTPTQGE